MPVYANSRDIIPIRPATNQVLCPQNTNEIKGVDGELWLRVKLE